MTTKTIIYVTHGIEHGKDDYSNIFGCFSTKLQAYKVACKKQYQYILEFCPAMLQLEHAITYHEITVDSPTSQHYYSCIKDKDGDVAKNKKLWIDYFKTKGCDMELHVSKPEDLQLFIDLEKMFNQVKDSNVLEEWEEFYNQLQSTGGDEMTMWDKFYQDPESRTKDYYYGREFYKQVLVSEFELDECSNTSRIQF